MKEYSVFEQLTYSTVRIEAANATGRSTGSAFIIQYEIDGYKCLFLVTNKHVVSGMTFGSFVFTVADADGNPTLKIHRLNVQQFESSWIMHPNSKVDICIMPLGLVLSILDQQHIKVFFRALPISLIPTPTEIENFDAVEEVYMIGYPNGIFDEVNNKPIVRKGITATEYSVNYNGEREFLIDMQVFPGSSGSPVMIIDKSGYIDKHGKMNIGNPRIHLLGIVYAVSQIGTTGVLKQVQIPTATALISNTFIPIGLGWVVKSECLKDFIPIIRDMLNKTGEI